VSSPVVHGRKLSWVRDRLPDGVPEHMRAERLLGTAPPPETSDNRDLIVEILDQGGLGSCVAHGTAQAARAEMVRAGDAAPPLGSRLWIYYMARAYDHDTANDDGTQIHNAFTAVAKYGMPAEAVWPYSDDSSPGAPFARMPPPDAFWAALDAKFTFRMHRISSTGYARVDDVKRALGQRRLIVMGTDVSEEFCAGQFDATVPLDPPVGLALAGGHCRAYVGHDARGVRVVNSWGPFWQDQGYSIDSWDYVTWANTGDLWVFDAAPKALGGAA
jgi:hypothetical protein